MLKTWLYYLLDKNGQSYYSENGLVQKSSSPKPLNETPDGWQDIQIGFERNLQKLGLVRSFTLPLTFVRSASEILRSVYFVQNFEAQIFLLIQKLSVEVVGASYRMIYRYFYRGEIDLSTYVYDDVKDTAQIIEGGIVKQVKANEGTVYPISLDDPEAVTVKADGINIRSNVRFATLDGLFIDDDDTLHNHTVPLAYINKEGNSTGAAFFEQRLEDILPNELNYVQNSNNYFLAVSDDADPIEFTITGQLRINISKNDIAAVLQFRYRTSTGGIVHLGSLSDLGESSLDISQVITLQPGEKLFLTAEVFTLTTGALGFDYTYQAENIDLKYKSRYKTTYIKALKPSTVLKKLTAKITGSESNCSTTFIEQFDHLLLTSGDGIRSLENASIKTSLNAFTEFVRTIMAGGQGIGNKLYFDNYEHFFNSSNPVELGNAKGLKASLAKEFIYNTIKIGYNEKKIDDVNGKYSFNNASLYSTPVTRVVKELTLICPYTADPFYLELTRVNLEGKTSTDNSADNEVFIVNVNHAEQRTFIADFDNFFAGAIKLYNGAADADYYLPGTVINISGLTTVNTGQYTVIGTLTQGADLLILTQQNTTPETGQEITINALSATLKRVTYDNSPDIGVPDADTIFNIEDLTPRRLLIKHKKFIDSIFYGFTGQKLKFQTTEKNADLVTVLNGEEIKEAADYTIGTDILFKPHYLEFDTEVPTNLTEILDDDPNCSFTPTWYNKNYTGFLIKAAISANDYKPQTFKLLCGPNTDLTQLK